MFRYYFRKYSFIFNRAKRNDRKTSYKLNLDEKKEKKIHERNF